MMVVFLRASQKATTDCSTFGIWSPSINTINSSAAPAARRSVAACGLWQSFFQLTMFTGELSDVLGCAEEEAWEVAPHRELLHHPVDQTHREADGLQQGGRWSCGAQEGFDLRPPTDSYCRNLKPKILQHTNNKLLGLTSHPVLFVQTFLQCF